MPAALIPSHIRSFRPALVALFLLTACDSEPPAIGARESNARATQPPLAEDPAETALSTGRSFPEEARIIGLSTGSANGGGAIVALGDRQRYVPAGGRLVPGWTLAAVEPAAAIFLGADGTERRLAIPEQGLADRAETAPRTGATSSDLDRLGTQLRLEMSDARSADGKRGRKFDSDPPPALMHAGVRRGDILVSYDGESFDRGEDIEDLLYLLKTRGSVPLVIDRAGRRVELTVRR